MSGIDPVNVESIIAQLEDMPAKVAEANRNIAGMVINRSRELVQDNLYPGHGYDTGQLHDSYGDGGEITDETEESITWEYGTDVEYSFVEFLWGGRISHFRPMLSALDTEVPLIMKEVYEDAMR